MGHFSDRSEARPINSPPGLGVTLPPLQLVAVKIKLTFALIRGSDGRGYFADCGGEVRMRKILIKI